MPDNTTRAHRIRQAIAHRVRETHKAALAGGIVDPVVVAVDLAYLIGADANLQGNLARVPAENALIHLRALSYEQAHRFAASHPRLDGQLGPRPKQGEVVAIVITAGFSLEQ